MAYTRSTLISRAGYSGTGGLGGFVDTIGDVAKGALTFFGAQQRAQGQADAAMALAQQQLAQQNQGISSDTLLVGAAVVGVAAFLILRKKKSA